MLHQTLILSSPLPIPSVSASPSSPSLSLFASSAKTTATAAAAAAATTASALLRSSSPAMPSYAHHHSSLDEGMDALKGSSRQEESAEEVAAAAEAPPAWGFADKDGFSVEDLLDLEEFCEGDADKDGGEEHEEPPAAVAAAKQDNSNDGSQQSAVSFELAPPAPEIVDLPAHDVEEELEWVSRIMDDSLSELPPQPAPPASMMASRAARPPQQQQHRLLLLQRRPNDGAYRALPSAASDPLRTPTICALSTEALVPVKAKRSKRSRASGWSLSGPAPDSTSSSSTATTSSCSSSASFSPYFLLDSAQLGATDILFEEYNLFTPGPKKSKHGKSKSKKRGRKPKHLPPHPAMSSPTPSDRRCSHCGVQKTPQWRAGPEGAKTLCNACGVRYKSGRLLPEYRPACSPTYVSTIHSNSHRKVLEMRRKKEDGPLVTIATAPAVPSF